MTYRFTYNRAVEVELANTPAIAAHLLGQATEAATAAKALAPVDDADYRDSIRAEVGKELRGYQARVNAYDFKAHWIEFGTGAPFPTRAYAPLRRGAETTGLNVTATSLRRVAIR